MSEVDRGRRAAHAASELGFGHTRHLLGCAFSSLLSFFPHSCSSDPADIVSLRSLPHTSPAGWLYGNARNAGVCLYMILFFL